MRKCSSCGCENADDSKFCTNCGTDLKGQPSTKECPNCGRECDSASKFCTSCGATLDTNECIGKMCPFCGTENSAESKFCVKCGASIIGAETSTIIRTNSIVSQANGETNDFDKTSSLNKVAMILGIVSVASMIVCCCGLFGFLSIIPGVLAIIFSSIYMHKHNSSDGKAIAGLILGIIGVLISITLMVTLPDLMESIKEVIVEACSDGTLDDETCSIYRDQFPEWFNWLFIK